VDDLSLGISSTCCRLLRGGTNDKHYSSGSPNARLWRQHEVPPMWRKVNTADKPLIIYPGELPTRLYRYRSIRPATLDRLIESEIIGEIIYLAGLKELNDPDEARKV